MLIFQNPRKQHDHKYYLFLFSDMLLYSILDSSSNNKYQFIKMKPLVNLNVNMPQEGRNTLTH